jgi:hypothetical protein
MADTLAGLAPRQTIFDRLRAPMAFLLIAAGTVGASYYFFLQRKIDYYTNRDARLIARSAQQIARAVKVADGIVKNAAVLKDENDLTALYKIEGRPSDEQRLPSKIFKEISTKPPEGKPSDELLKSETDPLEHRYATRGNDGLLLNFEVMTKDQKYASGKVELRQLLKPLQQSIAGVFDSFFILDSTGEVIYQAQKAPGDDSGSNVKIVRLNELAVSRPFEKAQTLKVADLMSVSRQMPIELGDNGYQLFSVPILSSVHIEEGAHEKGEVAKPNQTWVVCGLVSKDEFRSRSLQISVTVLSCLAAVVLLVIFSWPFVKMAMTGPQNKTTLFDVILLGVCGILATAIISLVAVDWLTYDKIEQGADQQLDRLARGIEDKFNADIATAVDQLDGVQRWAGTPPGTPDTPLPPGAVDVRSGNLPAAKFGTPFFQSVSLIDEKGMQRAKWSVDRVAPPLVNVAPKTYFAAPFSNGRDYIAVLTRRGEKRRLTIDSVRSSTTGQTEVVFARTIDEMAGDRSPLHERQLPGGSRFAVIAMSVSSPMSVLNAIVPEDFGFAIIDPAGTVLFHSQSERNTNENFFAETDQDPKLRAAVAARQTETTDVRYWGDDYRAHIYPLKRLPWTLVTFREKSGLSGINTEALLTTMLFLLVLHVGGLLLFIVIVLLLRPGYRAAWLWPDPNRLRDYSDLAIAYIALFVAGACLIGTMEDGALVAFPFAFVPFVLIITYVYLRGTRLLRAKIFLTFAVVAALLLVAAVWRSSDWDNVAAITAKMVASVLLLIILARAVFRSHAASGADGARERQMTLPLAYVSVAGLLLFVVSVVPAIAFFKAAYEIQVMSDVKFTQIQLARSLQNRWWRLAGEFKDESGRPRKEILDARWNNRQDIQYDAPKTGLDLDVAAPAPAAATVRLPWFEKILPHYSDDSVNTRELLHDRSADDRWEWTREGSMLHLTMRDGDPVPSFTIASVLPSPFPELRGDSYRVATGALLLLLILALALAIARFIGRRVFLVDVVHPLWLARGFLGLRHVICCPCDDESSLRLFRNFTTVDLANQSDLEIARTAPQSFPHYASTVFIDHLGYECATGENAEIVRGLLDRLTRNPDRTIVIRPEAMGAIAYAILQGPEGEAWSRILSTFVWVNGSQINTDADVRGVTVSGSMRAYEDSTPMPGGRKRWLKRLLHRVYLATGFGNYFEQMADSRIVDRTIAAEIKGDPYLETIITGLGLAASGRDQVLDEIGERAEEYYTALWNPCSSSEKLVLMQIAQTGLVNGKARKDVRRLLARGLLRRDPQLRLMNETFRRFVSAQAATSPLARQLEADLGSDAWSRFRVPFFAAVMVVLLFFFGTQRELFDSTFAVVGGLTATIPAILKMLSSFGERGAAKAA